MTRAVLFASLAVALTACEPGSDSAPDTPAASVTEAAVPDTVRVVLSSYGFETSRDTFEVNQSYTFELVNEADIAHEWAVVPRDAGDAAALIEVEEDDLPAGATQTVSFAFPEAGAYDFACFLEAPANHYLEGMVIPVTVVE